MHKNPPRTDHLRWECDTLQTRQTASRTGHTYHYPHLPNNHVHIHRLCLFRKRPLLKSTSRCSSMPGLLPRKHSFYRQYPADQENPEVPIHPHQADDGHLWDCPYAIQYTSAQKAGRFHGSRQHSHQRSGVLHPHMHKCCLTWQI